MGISLVKNVVTSDLIVGDRIVEIKEATGRYGPFNKFTVERADADVLREISAAYAAAAGAANTEPAAAS